MLDARGVARRKLLIGAAAVLALPVARAQGTRAIVDAAGRRVSVPTRVGRIYAAGPPASILVFALAPDALLGWTTPFRPGERPFVPDRYADLPTLGRLTGRGNTANVEVVLAAKPDVILDYGTVNATFASLADRVQTQIGIPYLLLDGAFDRIPEAFALLGELLDDRQAGAEWARYASTTVGEIQARVDRIPPQRRPRVYYGRGPTGLNTGLAGSINVESIERVGAVNVAAALGSGGLAQVSIEQVLGWAPDVVITTDPTFYANVSRDPLWQSVPAVRAGRVYLAPS